MRHPPREESVLRAEIGEATRLVDQSSAASTRIATAQDALRQRVRQVEHAIRKALSLAGVRDLDALHFSLLAALACLDANGEGIADRSDEAADYDLLNAIERAAPSPAGGDALESWRAAFAAAVAYDARIAALGRLEDELAARCAGPGERRAYIVLAGYHGRWEDGVNKTYGPGAEMMLNAWELASIGAHRVVEAE